MYNATPTVYSVSQLNNYVKGVLDADETLQHIFVSGEISNYKAHYSGHLYMTVKDDTSAVKAVMFAGNAAKLRFQLENGMKVIIFGTVSLYPRDGTFQLYISSMQPDGVGALNIAYEQLKKKLQAEGLFDPKHKKPIPQFPEKVGVVTSETGAAVQDIFNVLKRRYPAAQVILRPCKVQGEGAARDVADAIKEFNRLKGSDVLIVGRGGGSIEDLWAFNEEIVARAVYESEIPVISAVGHETDYTICDFTADLRAPTPSAAAECAVPDILELKANLLNCKQYMVSLVKTTVETEQANLKLLQKTYKHLDPLIKLNDNRRDLLYLTEKLTNAINFELDNKKNKISVLAGKLNTMSPLEVIARGYSIVQKDEKVVTSVKDINVNDDIILNLKDGFVKANVTHTIKKEN
ncbi:MAG: exodeoxyribonuclease VII large subunit [Acutalibacteraceae bacterium]